MHESIGTLFQKSRLLAKTINRITVEFDRVELTDWISEGKLLCSPGGSCFSSATLLVKGKHVPTYGFGGRAYGFLFNAERCNVYDVSARDSNSNRTTKMNYRTKRAGIDLLASNDVGLKTLDELSAEIMQADGEMNEILLDTWKESCVGLFVRKINIEKATPGALKHYYQTLLEVKLIHKLLRQQFDFPEDFQIYQYEEWRGALVTFPSNGAELQLYARMQGIHERTYPELFRLLGDAFHFPPLAPAKTVEEFLDEYKEVNTQLLRKFILKRLINEYEPFDAHTVTFDNILLEVVDRTTGVSEEMLVRIITECGRACDSKKFFYFREDEKFYFPKKESPELPICLRNY